MKIEDLYFADLMKAVVNAGYGEDIAWAEGLKEPEDAKVFARDVIFVICNSGMRFTVARTIFHKVMAALEAGQSVAEVFGHRGKVGAIEAVWKFRETHFAQYRAAGDKLAYLGSLPWIGEITKYHLAKNFGLPYAKPDVHLTRLAVTFQTTPQALCEALASRCGLKVATVDTLLWRAAAIGILDTSTGAIQQGVGA